MSWSEVRIEQRERSLLRGDGFDSHDAAGRFSTDRNDEVVKDIDRLHDPASDNLANLLESHFFINSNLDGCSSWNGKRERPGIQRAARDRLCAKKRWAEEENPCKQVATEIVEGADSNVQVPSLRREP
jgi:hypothetical protein